MYGPTRASGIKPMSESARSVSFGPRCSTRSSQQPQVGDPGAQGQHHEVHRGRLPELGLRPGPRGVQRRRRRSGTTAAAIRGDKILVKDAIADIILQQVLTAAGRVRRHRDHQPQRRLPFRRARGAGRRHRHRARGQHQLRHRPRGVRGDARHRAEVRGTGQGEPGLGHPVRRDDVRAISAGRAPPI